MGERVIIRDALPAELAAFGQLLVAVYSRLEGFPSPAEQPEYYRMLADVGSLARRPGARAIVAISDELRVQGGVVYFGDMSEYGAAGPATLARDAAGIRLLAVQPERQGQGIGARLTLACIQIAQGAGRAEVVLHTTRAMRAAWALYERLGFERAVELDFMQGGMPVHGFRLRLSPAASTGPETRSA